MWIGLKFDSRVGLTNLLVLQLSTGPYNIGNFEICAQPNMVEH